MTDAFHGKGNFKSLTLDEENCIITYNGLKDVITGGVKPIAIQVEDFDKNGKVKSSIPVQFLATVWQPRETGNQIIVARDQRGNEMSEAYLWGDVFFASHDHHHTDDHDPSLDVQ